tara:strand:+ start:615 stop:830 length:216 start_codon:yes stop_codon:yes gene_type:complete
MTNTFDDTSRWTIFASRFDTPQILREAMDEMFDEFIASLPEDSPALALYHLLPKPPESGAEVPSTKSILTL